ncbi:tryptophan 2,3-dioxygenase-like [Haliotis rufescens]|uniref:tryptophan 2,3-dioxygenase-like n=1 Tax=Haliotis rufescens TaxID=6454 RepID=UPI00201F802D|nr:tryptophan 2,3-dioxygenase-like [Haliotis rufescens]XP_048259493.1 tryptophan 2,3-dioxygenase-like [Haliotis rufescens]XP_048259494.1 tryptophan 2,3-dioxygenase-like [Haliotis rufescens]XP_048259495.1 tryptophan 2,3-dioxygenase-like [Haliotis rufescens]
MAEKPKLTYDSYLKITPLLECQEPISEAHDEHLFIIVHQAFELWFKQVLHDVDSVRMLFYDKDWDNIPLHKAINRLQRVVLVLKLVVEQFHILETMPPLNFVDFRDELTGGSGFQSLQFRKIEKLLGIKDNKREKYEDQDYQDKMDPNDKKILLEYPDKDGGGTLRDVVGIWLSSTPGIDDSKFWGKYRQNKEELDPLLDESKYKTGSWQMSQRSLKGALLIMLHQDKPEFQMPYQIITLLMDIDVALMKWRSTHIHMVHRMIGQKQGTGGTKGTSGCDYLRATYNDNYKVFRDLFNMATYLRPREEIPKMTDPTGC